MVRSDDFPDTATEVEVEAADYKDHKRSCDLLFSGSFRSSGMPAYGCVRQMAVFARWCLDIIALNVGVLRHMVS